MAFEFKLQTTLYSMYSNVYPLFFMVTGTSPVSVSAEVSGLKDQSVMLPCQLKPDDCGSVHSIKWYRGDRRVYIYSDIASLSRAEDDLAER